jgi:uncharacterized membrane-anchored protein YitT (DUF2179 family)
MKKIVNEYFLIALGIFIVALSIHLFMIPNNFVIGGISGLAIVINSLIPTLEVGLIMIILDIILFTLGFITIGAHFGGRTLFSSFLLSGSVWFLNLFFPITEPLVEDRFIQLILCIVLSAVGMAVVFRHNASTGGTDITAKILNKFFHIDLGKGVLLSDLVVTLLAFVTFDLDTVFYGIVGIFLNGLIIDFILNKFKESKEVRIITHDLSIIKPFIMDELERSATIYKGYGAYTNEERAIITTILNRHEYIRLKKFIGDSKIEAFITVSNINEAFGLGFESLTE